MSVCRFVAGVWFMVAQTAMVSMAAEFHSFFTPRANEFSTTSAVSADGSVVIGYGRWGANSPCTPEPEEACGLGLPFTWTEGKGVEFLDTLDVVVDPDWPGLLPILPTFPVLGIQFPPRALSADGTMFVGQSVDHRPFRWNEADGAVDMAASAGRSTFGEARDTSADGSVVVGWITDLSKGAPVTNEAFRWSENDGMMRLGDLPGGQFSGEARGVSADGSVVVGQWSPGVPSVEAFHWTAQTGMVGLGVLPGHGKSEANDISANGSVIVGGSRSRGPEADDHAFRWTEDSGMVDLGLGESLATNSDGSMVVGSSEFGGLGRRAAVWDSEHGMRFLEHVLVNDFGLGEQLQGWTLTEATDISDDGTTIVGNGTGPTGKNQAWRAVINPTRLAGLLQPGDADQDLDFDQADLVRVQVAGRYLTGEMASWGQGDWNGAPGGMQDSPPKGDGVFDQHGIIAALRRGIYLTGSYGATSENQQNEDVRTSALHDSAIGELALATASEIVFTSTEIIAPAERALTRQAGENLAGAFDSQAISTIFEATFGTNGTSQNFARWAAWRYRETCYRKAVK